MIERDSLRVTIGANVRRLRTASGLSQEAFAEQVGISAVTLNRVEMGRSTPLADLLYGLADALGVSADVLRQETDVQNGRKKVSRAS